MKLHEIIHPPNVSSMNEQSEQPSIESTVYIPDELPGFYLTNEQSLTAIPRNAIKLSFLEMCIFVYWKYVLVAMWCSQTIDWFSNTVVNWWNFVTRSQSDAKINKMLIANRNKIIREQVKAMIPHIVYFNYRPTLWEIRNSSLHGNYLVRDRHRSEYNRHITLKLNQEENI